MGQLADLRGQRPPTRSAKEENQQTKQHAQEGAADQQREGIAVCEHARAGCCTEAPHGPSVVKVRRQALRAPLRGATAERDIRGAGPVAELHRTGGVAAQGLFQHDPRCEHLVQPSDERCPAARSGGRRGAPSVEGCHDAQGFGPPHGGRGVAARSRASQRQQCVRQRTVAPTHRRSVGGAPREFGDGGAVIVGLAGGNDPNSCAFEGR